MKTYLQNISILCLILFLFYACEKEKMSSSSDSLLHFSTDTVTFDTLFTTLNSPTKNFRVVNKTNDNLIISSIRLAGGEQSGFRLNINGDASNESSGILIPPKDSIFIFVEAKLLKSGINQPLVNEDSIIFRINNIEQKVRLLAWGQDFNLVKTDIKRNTLWTKDKPYLVFNEISIDSLSTLTIEPGTTIFFHKNSGLVVKGTLKAVGELDQLIDFRGDRLESGFSELPDQWNGIILTSGSHNNKINYARIRNANIGLQVGTIEHSGYASVELGNTRIENMSWAGIWAMKSKINAYNCVISNALYYNTALLLGGEYQFTHTTFANFSNRYSSGIRTNESVVVSNFLLDNKTKLRFVGDLKSATFANCIISGNQTNELQVAIDKKGTANYLFDRCLIQLSDTVKLAEPNKYIEIIRNINPRFKNPVRGNFELDTLSICKNYGRISYAKSYPTDMKGENRLLDAGPDLGAFERIERKPPTGK